MTAKEYLRQARTLDARIEADIEELSKLRAQRAGTMGAGYGTERTSGGGLPSSPTERRALKIVEYEQRINDEIDRLIDLKSEIRETIERMTDPNEKAVLHMRYVAFLPWEEIRERMHYSDVRSVYYLHGRALMSFSCFFT